MECESRLGQDQRKDEGKEDAFMQELVSVQNRERDGFKPSKSISYYKCNAYVGYWKFEK